ncbi:MFS transporter [Legionella micdadei]|uniref:2-acylglycerophosphoethanolamine acyltransferase n=1 Tax=Legionella micdadei TaxID=451 RepID=A0A098GDQ5_LEGMI|nr:MFS transporter [Legionella micdadei]ARG97794.1 MFS transporter [Legionella micdadei]ARG99889.1 MFS transporter [Legionella micdadei]KTD28506.1 2-acylglycerophosphoethanolamine acyltransferase [Legionella micdadei]CEG60604.1 2-acylglycerophosphoethanolamine acyltransferase [Legionella micdadei]SCX83083.1 Major Facilitator Superfamily protein [Legionella micdadei]
MGNLATYLLNKKTFLPLFLTQFFSAFNDNAFKLSMLTLISYHLSTSQNQSEYYQALAGALFTLPFFLFSATAGQLADKYDKALMTKLIKVFEVVLMCVGSFALYSGSIYTLLFCLAGMGIHSTFFGPIKYAILPDHLPREQLLKATGLIEASTFLAILLGTSLGALAIGTAVVHVGYAILIVNLIAVLGLTASCYIPAAPSITKGLIIDWRIGRATWNMLKDALKNHRLLPAILAISWFWLIGAVMLTKLPDYTHYVLWADTSVFAVFLSLFSIGIALGALSISYFLASKITLRYVPIAMFMLSVFAIDLYLASPKITEEMPLQTFAQFFIKPDCLRITVDFFLFSFCAGLFVVPLYTYLQVSSDEGTRARTIAANNIINALFMVLGSIMVMVLLQLNVGIALVFLIVAILNAAAAFALWLLLLIQAKRLMVQVR